MYLTERTSQRHEALNGDEGPGAVRLNARVGAERERFELSMGQ